MTKKIKEFTYCLTIPIWVFVKYEIRDYAAVFQTDFYSDARRMIVYLMRKYSGLKLSEIANIFNMKAVTASCDHDLALWCILGVGRPAIKDPEEFISLINEFENEVSIEIQKRD